MKFKQHHRARQPDGSVVRVKDVARVDLGAKTAGALQPVQRGARRGDRHLPSPGASRRSGTPGPRGDGGSEAASGRCHLRCILGQHCIRDSHCRRGRPDLAIAFVLVAIVVFLFLGKLRTTVIRWSRSRCPIIGTFAVMLAIGYSANTVSLLALVLAIGIVVDDAIVVIGTPSG